MLQDIYDELQRVREELPEFPPTRKQYFWSTNANRKYIKPVLRKLLGKKIYVAYRNKVYGMTITKISPALRIYFLREDREWEDYLDASWMVGENRPYFYTKLEADKKLMDNLLKKREDLYKSQLETTKLIRNTKERIKYHESK